MLMSKICLKYIPIHIYNCEYSRGIMNMKLSSHGFLIHRNINKRENKVQIPLIIHHNEKKQRIYFRDATIPFFQIRSDPENSEYRPIPIRSDPIPAQFFFKINVEFLYFCVTLLCVKHNLQDTLILIRKNMKKYIGAVYTWSLHAFCNINPIAQNTSGGGLGCIPDETGHV